jgi:hypothetical protein
MVKHADDATPLLTLEQLAEKLPAADKTLRDELASDPHAREELIALGRKIKTAKIIIDEQRLYNQAFQFFQTATPDQKRKLVGFTPALLAAAVAEALRDQSLAAGIAERTQHAGVASATATGAAARAHADAIALRDQAIGLLKSGAARNKNQLATIDAAHVNTDVATALGELAKLGDAMLSDKKGGGQKRAAIFNLTADFIAELRDAKAAVSSADLAHVGKTRAGDQAALDLEDGISLHFLGSIVTAFESAHDRDQSIPRLVPIATRRLIGAHSHGTRATVAAPPAPPAPAQAPSA